MTEKYAFDRSGRTYDSEGRLHVQCVNISKAMVCPYYGYEIPDEGGLLNLDPQKSYMLLRDPAELRAGASTFNNIQLLAVHIPVNASEPRKEVTVGTTGSDVVYDAPYLKCSIAVWDAAAIRRIENDEQRELSSSYRYRADMTPGEYEGAPYDGVMRDIIGNHVALVEIGRAGPDVVVSDALPAGLPTPPLVKGVNMKKQRKPIPSELLAGLVSAAVASAKPLFAADAKPEDLSKVFLKLAKDAELAAMDPALDAEPDDEEMEDDPDKPGEKRKKAKPANDAPPAGPEGGAAKPAMDAAAVQLLVDAGVAKTITAATEAAVARTNELHSARELVAPLVGKVAMDSAEAVYRFALDKAGVDTKGVHASALRPMVELALKHADSDSSETSSRMANDSLVGESVTKRIPGLSRFMN